MGQKYIVEETELPEESIKVEEPIGQYALPSSSFWNMDPLRNGEFSLSLHGYSKHDPQVSAWF